nr:hypothetical protein [Gemmatimonadales bacterium]
AAVLRAWRAAGGLPGFKRPGVLHWTVDGEPACLSKLTFDSVYNPPSMCAPWTRELAEAYRLRVLAAHPGVDVAIVEGPCTGDPEVGQ